MSINRQPYERSLKRRDLSRVQALPRIAQRAARRGRLPDARRRAAAGERSAARPHGPLQLAHPAHQHKSRPRHNARRGGEERPRPDRRPPRSETSACASAGQSSRSSGRARRSARPRRANRAGPASARATPRLGKAVARTSCGNRGNGGRAQGRSSAEPRRAVPTAPAPRAAEPRSPPLYALWRKPSPVVQSTPPSQLAAQRFKLSKALRHGLQAAPVQGPDQGPWSGFRSPWGSALQRDTLDDDRPLGMDAAGDDQCVDLIDPAGQPWALAPQRQEDLR